MKALAGAGRVALGWLALAVGYLAVLLAAAAARRPRAGSPAPGRLAILVPAHDEERGIEATVRALLAVADPETDVVVIADNCTDTTARRARDLGAEVWERHDDARRGKGQALAWALERLLAQPSPPVFVAVVDADCQCTPNLVGEWRAGFGRGAAAVQADYRVGNPEASPASARRWAGFALMHAIRGNGKDRLGLSCGLFGTGMAFRASVLREVPWTSFSVTEDAEYHLSLVEAGHVVRFAGAAAVVSDMPATEAEADAQQLRWESGKVKLARETFPRLVADGVRRRDPQRLHLALEQAVPPQSLVGAAAVGLGAVGALTRDRTLVRGAARCAAGQVLFVLGGLVVARAPAPVWRSLATAPAGVARKLGQAARITRGRGATDWVRTGRG